MALHLPMGAQIWASLGEDRAWTVEAHLMASAVDALHGANWQRGDGKSKKPDPIPRPQDMAKRAEFVQRNLAKAERFRQRTSEG